MKKKIFIFILFLLFFIIIKAPSSVLNKYYPHVVFSGKMINGTALHNKIGTIKWRLKFIYLLAGKVVLVTSIIKDDNKINTTFSINLLGNIELTKTNGIVDSNYLQQFITNMPKIMLTKFRINKLNIDVNNKKLTTLIDIVNLNILGEDLGSYKLQAVVANHKIIANIKDDKNAKLTVIANAKSIDNVLFITGNIDGKDKNSRELLRSIGISNIINVQLNISKYNKLF